MSFRRLAPHISLPEGVAGIAERPRNARLFFASPEKSLARHCYTSREVADRYRYPLRATALGTPQAPAPSRPWPCRTMAAWPRIESNVQRPSQPQPARSSPIIIPAGFFERSVSHQLGHRIQNCGAFVRRRAGGQLEKSMQVQRVALEIVKRCEDSSSKFGHGER